MGEGPNDEKPKVSIRENTVEVKIPRERVIVGMILSLFSNITTYNKKNSFTYHANNQ